MRELFSFPNPVNEKAARTVAGVVLATVVVILATVLLAARPAGLRVLGPRPHRADAQPAGLDRAERHRAAAGREAARPGPPKRFAQLMGAVMSTAALVLALVAGDHTAADVVLVLFLPAAGLESIAGYCVGCKVFGLLMRGGLVPETVCAECADIRPRLQAAAENR